MIKTLTSLLALAAVLLAGCGSANTQPTSAPTAPTEHTTPRPKHVTATAALRAFDSWAEGKYWQLHAFVQPHLETGVGHYCQRTGGHFTCATMLNTRCDMNGQDCRGNVIEVDGTVKAKLPIRPWDIHGHIQGGVAAATK